MSFLRGVNLKRFAYWLAVVDEGSFTRVAGRLHIAQPSLSQQVRALEAELGGQLIERLPGAIRLTAAGKAFLPEARSAVLSADRAVRSARAALKLETGELEIATVRSIAVGLLPPSVSRWHTQHPAVLERLHEYAHRELLAEAVFSGVGDIAIGPRPQGWQGPLVSLGWEEFVLVLPPGDPLAAEPSVARADARAQLGHLPARARAVGGARDGVRAGRLPPQGGRAHQPGRGGRAARRRWPRPCARADNMVPLELEAAVRHADPPIVRELVAFTRTEWSPSARGYLDILHEYPWKKCPRPAFAVY